MIDKNTLDNYNKHLSKKDSQYRAKRKANVGMYLGMAKEFAPKSLGSADELVASKIKQKQKSSDWWNTSPNERKARGYAKGGSVVKQVRLDDGKLYNEITYTKKDLKGKPTNETYVQYELVEKQFEKGGKTKTIKRSGKWGKNYSELCSELATYKDGGSLWIETDKEPPVNEGAFVGEAEKRNMSVKELMNKALKYPTREDFDSDGEYETYADSKKGKQEIKLRKQAQMVKNMGNYEMGGSVDGNAEVVEVRYRGLPIDKSLLGLPVLTEEITDKLEEEFSQELTFTPIKSTNLKPVSYEVARKHILIVDESFHNNLLKGYDRYAKGGNVVDGISQEFYGMNIAEIDGEGIDDVRKLKAIIFELNNRLEEEKGILPFDSEAQGFDEDGNPYGIDNLPFSKGGWIDFKSKREINKIKKELDSKGVVYRIKYDMSEDGMKQLGGGQYKIEESYAKGGKVPSLKGKIIKGVKVTDKYVSIRLKGGDVLMAFFDNKKVIYDSVNSEVSEDMDAREEVYAKGGDTSEYEVKKVVNGNNGSWTLEEYQNLPNKDWMGKEPLSLERTIEKVFELNDEAMDYEDEIREAEDVDALGEILKDNDLVEGFNTYNNSWWGGTRQYYILKNWDDKLDLDYETIVFLSFHRGGDVRGNYEKFEAFEIDAYGYEDFPVYSDRLSYVITKGDKSATFDTEDDEGYSLYTIEDDFGKFEVDDSTDTDKVSEEFNVSLY
jgi:hypothetical protein